MVSPGRPCFTASASRREPFRLQAVGPEGTDHIGQTFRPVAQGEAPPVFDDPSGGGAQIVQRAQLLAPGGPAAPAAACGEIGRVGDCQVEASRREGSGAQVAGEDPPLQAVDSQILPGGPGGQGVDIDPGEGQSFLTPGQEEEEGAAARPQVADPPPGLDRRELPQSQGVAPQGEDAVRPGQGVGAQLFGLDHRGPLYQKTGEKDTISLRSVL